MPCIKRRKAYQSMHAPLRQQITIGMGPLDLDDSALDPCLLSRGDIENLCLIGTTLCPTEGHPEQHLRPILGLCSSRASMNGENSVTVVIFPTEAKLEL